MAQEVSKNGSNDDVNMDKTAAAEKRAKAVERKDSDEYLLDMVFVLDCTGSMASYINSARDNIVKVSQELSKLSEKQAKKAEQLIGATDDGKAEEKKGDKNDDVSMDKDKTDNDKDKDKDKEKQDKEKNQDKKNDVNMEGQVEGMVDTGNGDKNDKGDQDSDNKEKETEKEKEKEKEKDAESKENKENKEDDESKINNPEPKKKLSCKFAVVAYRDHPPQDSTFITQIRDFTGSSVMINQYLSTLTANGGGDGPESLTTALYDTLHNLKYRENSQRVIIVITDAPCHGIEDSSTTDGFPNGDPFPKYKLASKKASGINKNKFIGVKTREQTSGEEKSGQKMPDILEIARDITDNLQASFYTVACEPCLSTNYDYARDLMEALAEMSNGKYVPLASANLLPKVIIGSVKQQMLIDELTAEIDKEIEELKQDYASENKELTEDAIAEFMEKKWENANLTYKEVTIGTLYRKERRRDNIEFLLNRQECQTLKDFGKKRIKFERLNHNDFRHLKTSSSSSSSSSSFGSRSSRFSRHSHSTLERASIPAAPASACLAAEPMSKSKGFSFGGMMDSVSSFFGGSSSSSSSKTKSSSKPLPFIHGAHTSCTDTTVTRPKRPMLKASSTKKNDMTLAMRYGDDDDEANLSCSDDEQEVYEQVKSMDSKGVRKAVSRYMQTY